MAEFYWSATKVNAANYGTCRYYLRYMLKFPELRFSAYVKGSLLHTAVEHFWERLGTPEEVASTSKKFKDKKYYDALSFARHIQGVWQSVIIADKTAPEKITWRHQSEPYTIRAQLKEICIPLFQYLSQMGPPTFAELPFDFKIGDERFKGRIDEVRVSPKGQIVLIDYKSGRPWVGQMKLANDPQLTLYNVGLCSLIKFDPKIRAALGLEGKIDEFMGGGKFVSPNIKEGFFMIESLAVDPEKVRSMPEIIYETARTDENFFALLKMIQSVRERANKGDVYPESGKKCDDCGMREACKREMLSVNKGNYADKSGNGLFDFAAPGYARKEAVGNIAFALADQEKPLVPPTKAELNKTSPQFRFRYTKPQTS